MSKSQPVAIARPSGGTLAMFGPLNKVQKLAWARETTPSRGNVCFAL